MSYGGKRRYSGSFGSSSYPKPNRSLYSKAPRIKSYRKNSDVIRNSGHCDIRVKHKEYITDLESSKVFNNQLLDVNGHASVGSNLNPTNINLFPWLAQLATQFEEWIPHSIKFHFKTTSTDLAGSGTNPALGTVIMATDYNVYNAKFASKQQMENYEGAVSCKPSVNMYHHVNCSRNNSPVKELYTRTQSSFSSTADRRLYDLGTFQIATTGMQSTQALIGGMRPDQ